jgi:3-oxoacyl-[acyl-carrier protein] reductase
MSRLTDKVAGVKRIQAHRQWDCDRRPADVSKATDVARLFKKEVDAAFGRLDVLVNNAGVFRFGAFTDITEESFYVHYNVNVLGAILTVQQAIKRFGAEGGSVINISSIVGSRPVAGALLYASTKGAIKTLD